MPRDIYVSSSLSEGSRDSHENDLLPARPVSLARLYHESLLRGSQVKFAQLRYSTGLVGDVADAVLPSQLLYNRREDAVQGLLLRDFEEAAPRLFRHPAKHLSAVLTAEDA